MSANSKILHSRADWKKKATARANTSRDRAKTIKRQSRRICEQNRVIREQGVRIAELEVAASKPTVTIKVEVVLLALQLFSVARISVRAISRVLKLLSAVLGGFKAPCAQTVSNWLNKLSLSRLWTLPDTLKRAADAMFTNGWMYLIDESIGHASGKMLLVLRVRADHYTKAIGYPGMATMLPVAVAVSASWTGEAIADLLQTLTERCGRPTGYILDGGSNLNKAVNILNEREVGSQIIRDISHYFANLLEATYGCNPSLDSFLSTCGDCATRLKQSILACLMPPKVRTKARFMNLHRLMRWAQRILNLSPVGRAPSGSMLEKLRNSISELPQHKAFVERFLVDANIGLACQKVLKELGLTRESKAECRRLIRDMPDRDPIKLGIIDWLSDHIKVARDLGLQDTGMLVSSDGIESVFGLSKTHGMGSIKDPLRMALRVGAICGDVSREDAIKVVAMPHSTLVNATPTPSLQANRVAVLGGNKDIEDVDQRASASYFCLMPPSKNRDDSNVTCVKTEACWRPVGPQEPVERRIS